MKVISLNQRPTKEEALDIIDGLRRDMESGKLVAFFGVGISDDDGADVYVGTTKPVSRLRVIGAVSYALHAFQSGEIE